MFHFPAYPRNNKVPCRPMTAGGLPHSEILGSKPCWRLPEAYRILKRPSSVLSAKASTIRPSGRHTPRKTLMIAFLRQTTNHHTVKNDHKTIDLETRLIQKRRAWRNRDKASRTKNPALLASTIQFSNHHAPRPDPARGPQGRRRPARGIRKTARTQNGCGWRSGNPKAYPHHSPQGPKDPRSQRSLPHQHAHAKPETIPGTRATRRTPDRRPEKLRRKEVIQPHLPVRLPCYDLVPITSLTLDGSIPQGVRPPASGATHFHDLTGGVYKARERIHRGVADPRLLATPPSWSRVADSNPN